MTDYDRDDDRFEDPFWYDRATFHDSDYSREMWSSGEDLSLDGPSQCWICSEWECSDPIHQDIIGNIQLEHYAAVRSEAEKQWVEIQEARREIKVIRIRLWPTLPRVFPG